MMIMLDTQRKPSTLRKIVFTKDIEANIGHLHYLFFLCLLMMHNQTGSVNFSFGSIGQLKTQAINPTPNTMQDN